MCIEDGSDKPSQYYGYCARISKDEDKSSDTIDSSKSCDPKGDVIELVKEYLVRTIPSSILQMALSLSDRVFWYHPT